MVANFEGALYVDTGATAVILFKSCPKCRGDLLEARDDQFGAFSSCVQCGTVVYPPRPDLALEELLAIAALPPVRRGYRLGTTRVAQRVRPWGRNGENGAQRKWAALPIWPRST